MYVTFDLDTISNLKQKNIQGWIGKIGGGGGRNIWFNTKNYKLDLFWLANNFQYF